MAAPENPELFEKQVMQSDSGMEITVYIEAALLAERPRIIEFLIQHCGQFELSLQWGDQEG
jgi:hypothetical protein